MPIQYRTEKLGLAKLLLKCSHQALRIEYLSTKGFVDRDLEARNVLVTQDYSYTCKVESIIKPTNGVMCIRLAGKIS